MSTRDNRPLVVHVVYRFDVGGLENGVVNLINHMPAERYRHLVLALTDISDFRQRVLRDDVTFIALHKPPGHAIWLYPRLYRLFRELKPAIVHSRNLAALEVQVPAWLAGVAVRIHGEHGRDMDDLDGTKRKYQWLRRLYQPFVTHYIALSRDLAGYLTERVGIAPQRISQIYNGVDARNFQPARPRAAIAGSPFNDPALYLIGTVGRMQAVKDQTLLAKAFIATIQRQPALQARLRLILIGEGPLRAEAQSLLSDAGLAHLAWLPGERHDIAAVLRGFDLFVLPSLAEGVSNTILEAMATGLPVVATAVGGNAELIESGQSGLLVPAGNVDAMADALRHYAEQPESGRIAGQLGRQRVERQFSLDAMVARYQACYDQLSHRQPAHSASPASTD